MTNSSGGSRVRSVAGNTLIFLTVLGLAGSSLVKFAQVRVSFRRWPCWGSEVKN